MGKKREHLEWCDRSLIVSPYYYCLVITEEQFNTELDRLKIPRHLPGKWVSQGSDATVHFLLHGETGRKIAIVALDDSKKVTATQKVALIVHEAVHIWQHIVEELGETNPSNEFEAYSIQAITQELLLAYDRAKSKKKSK